MFGLPLCTYTFYHRGIPRESRVRNIFWNLGKNTIFNEHPVTRAPRRAICDQRADTRGRTQWPIELLQWQYICTFKDAYRVSHYHFSRSAVIKSHVKQWGKDFGTTLQHLNKQPLQTKNIRMVYAQLVFVLWAIWHTYDHSSIINYTSVANYNFFSSANYRQQLILPESMLSCLLLRNAFLSVTFFY